MVQDEDDGLGDLSNRQMLKIIMTEIADVRFELKQDIEKIDIRMDGLESRMGRLESEVHDVKLELRDVKLEVRDLKLEVKDLRTDMGNLKIEVRDNHTTFIRNFENVDRRVTVLEAR
jgi:chromosome segregation ATPase